MSYMQDGLSSKPKTSADSVFVRLTQFCHLYCIKFPIENCLRFISPRSLPIHAKSKSDFENHPPEGAFFNQELECIRSFRQGKYLGYNGFD